MSIIFRKRRIIGLVAGGLLLVFSLAACGGAAPAAANEAVDAADAGINSKAAVIEPAAEAAEGESNSGNSSGITMSLAMPASTLVDDQGAVEVAVTPLAEASAESGRLVFEVSMNTHSVDLSMDLADLALLETDNGLSLPAAAWSGGSGHHVTGSLEFELPQGAEMDQLAQAARWILTIRQVDAAQRVYEWDLGQVQ